MFITRQAPSVAPTVAPTVYTDRNDRHYVDVIGAANGSDAWTYAETHGLHPQSTMQFIGTTQRVYLED